MAVSEEIYMHYTKIKAGGGEAFIQFLCKIAEDDPDK